VTSVRTLARGWSRGYPSAERMDVVYLDNRGKSVGSAVEEALESATDVSVAVAYSTESGVESLEQGITHVAGRGGWTRLITGLDDFVTDLSAVERVSRLPQTECRVFLPKSAGEGGRFHPKLYVFEGEEESSVIVGSANLTDAGLFRNHEASVWLRGKRDDPILRQVRDGFGLLWSSPRAVTLDPDLRRTYEVMRQARQAALGEVVELEEYRRATARLRADVARALIRPGSRRWLMITSPTNFEICLRLSRWGDERWSRIARVQPGDGIVFYVKGEYSLGAMAVAVGQARPSNERPWPDRPYPFQMDLEFLAVAEPRPSIRPLIDRLHVFRDAVQSWGQYLQTTLKEIDEHDFQLLASAIGAAGEGLAIGSRS
jgi:HKD family nuclease